MENLSVTKRIGKMAFTTGGYFGYAGISDRQSSGGRTASRHPERPALREGKIDRTGRQQQRCRGRTQHERDCRALTGHLRQGHFTVILLANCAP